MHTDPDNQLLHEADDARRGRLSIARIAAARASIDPALLDSPQLRHAALSRHLGCELVLKDETANPLGCFKGRGADLFVSRMLASLPDAAANRQPLVCASAGNFGLALADAGRRRGVPVIVFVSESASPFKIERIRACGAEVIQRGRDFDGAKDFSREYAIVHGGVLVEDGAEPAISEGAGTIAVELGEAGPFDAIVVPVGNGALVEGVATWIKAHAPRTRVVGVCSEGAPVMRDCWRHGLAAATDEARADTIADGIAVRVPVAAVVGELRHLVDEFVAVGDPELVAAMQALHALTGLVAEPSAVAGIAAIAAQPERYAGLRVATVLTGRNLTGAQRAQWLRGSHPTKE